MALDRRAAAPVRNQRDDVVLVAQQHPDGRVPLVLGRPCVVKLDRHFKRWPRVAHPAVRRGEMIGKPPARLDRVLDHLRQHEHGDTAREHEPDRPPTQRHDRAPEPADAREPVGGSSSRLRHRHERRDQRHERQHDRRRPDPRLLDEHRQQREADERHEQRQAREPAHGHAVTPWIDRVDHPEEVSDPVYAALYDFASTRWRPTASVHASGSPSISEFGTASTSTIKTQPLIRTANPAPPRHNGVRSGHVRSRREQP